MHCIMDLGKDTCEELPSQGKTAEQWHMHRNTIPGTTANTSTRTLKECCVKLVIYQFRHLMKTRCLFLIGLSMMITTASSAQNEAPAFELPRTNPKAIVQQQVAATTIEVAYYRPSVRGREIFGALVPYDHVWRTGADAATTISFSTPVTIAGTHIDAGKYELFTIPGTKEWAIILQRAHSQWGSYAYDPAFNVAQVVVQPKTLQDHIETFTISIDDVKSNAATLHIAWERTRVSLQIEIDLQKTVIPQLEDALRSEGRRPYFLAAMFYFENNIDINRAAELMTAAVEQNPNHLGMLYRLALILERKGDITGAIAAAEKSQAEATKANPELRDEYTRLNTALLARLRQH